MLGWVYILECADGNYYTGSTVNLTLRMLQHKNGDGSNHTKKRLPVKLIYFQEFSNIADAFKREKQIQGWPRAKKDALISSRFCDLNNLAICQNESHYLNKKVTSASLSHPNQKSIL